MEAKLSQGSVRIGELAKQCGVTVKALRLYEARGCIAPLSREENGYRHYDPSLVQEVRLITMMISLGLRLDDIRGILAPDAPLRSKVDVTITRERMSRSTRAFRKRVDAIDNEIAALAECRERLLVRIRYCADFLASNQSATPDAPRVIRRSKLPGRVAYEFESLERGSDTDIDSLSERSSQR